MQLTAKGAHAAQLGHHERHELGERLMAGADAREYVNGICYDVVAFVRFLLGARIAPNDLINTSAQAWKAKFNFQHGPQWDGRSPIPRGTAIGFARDNDKQVFHTALAVGGTEVRGVNGLTLGNGWVDKHDLKRELKRSDKGMGLFVHDNTLIRVHLSSL
jgi:hypothetical protein